MRIALAVLLAMHGIAHLVGFAVPWRLVTAAEMPYRTTIAGGVLDLGATGIRVYGVLWLVLTIAFLRVSVQLFKHGTTWPGSLLAVACASVVLCALSLPQAWIGLVVSALLVVLAVVVRF